MKELGDILLDEYIKWCRLPWWRRAWRRLLNTGPVFAGHKLPECFADKPEDSQ